MTILTMAAKGLHLISRQFLPKQMRLMGLYHTYLLDNPEPELLHLTSLLRRHRTAIDVGANVGYWTYKMAGLFEQVISVEMNEDCYQHIENARLENVCLLKHGLSDQERMVPFYLPVHANGFISHGWGTVEHSRKDDLFDEILERRYLVKPLDSYGFTNVDFIKIDVEGHELAVIDGGLETIRRSRPVLVIEASRATLSGLNKRLAPMGYRQHILADLIGKPGSEGNYIFLAN